MIQLDGSPLTLAQVAAVARRGETVALSPFAREAMKGSRSVVDRIASGGRAVYGVNTGFGKLSDVAIPADRLSELQLNLVRSHACGVGEPLSQAETRALMLLRTNVLAIGLSGARAEVAEHLIAMLNAGIHPVIPSRGSVGASGDLAPLAHLALAAIGEWDVEFKGRVCSATEAFAQCGLHVLRLESKEGLALLNGTQAIGSVGCLAVADALRLVERATNAGAMSLEALKGTPAAFDARIHKARRHDGQERIAAWLLEALDGSEIRDSHRENDPRVQDAYALRCMPQVHGAVLSALEHTAAILEAETGAATDNPLVFAEEGEVVSGGNFHGAPLAYALDYAAIALTDLGSISERRIDRLVNPDLNEGLPAFLALEPGMESGHMIPHVVAAALLNECKVLSHPASIDSVPTSGGKEDHVSMGMMSALKFRQIVGTVARIIAIELLAAADGLEFRRPLRSGPGVESTYQFVRSMSPRLERDRPLSREIEALASKLTG